MLCLQCLQEMQEQNIYVQQGQQNNEQIDEQLPNFGQFQGQQIKLSGLDYKLLQQQKQKQADQKKGFLHGLKSKLNIISGNVLDRVIKEQKQQKVIEEDPQLKKIMTAFEKNIANKKTTHKRNQEKIQLCYEFDLDQFGSRYPKQVQKRLGKMSKKPVYLHFDQNFFQGFRQSFVKKQREEDQMVDARGIMGDEDDSDDIFGDDGDDGEQKQKNAEKVDISIGKKLQFGLEEDIFAQKRNKPIQDPQFPISTSVENDKYFFMRKKVKKNTINEDDGYGECYYQSGPSLQQLVDMKKQGIEYFADAKEFKAKEKKAPNINQQYNKIQKIIEKKNKS